jgi:hypothetical protein
MELIPAPLLACTAELNTRVGLLGAARAEASSMSEGEYEIVTAALAEVTRVFTRHEGAFSSADLRTRSLVNLAEKEVARSLLETVSHNHRRQVTAGDEKEKIEAPAASYLPPPAHTHEPNPGSGRDP